jgi:hypothetical protein
MVMQIRHFSSACESTLKVAAAMLPALALAGAAVAQNVQTDPIQCWWRTSAGAIRAGEPFSLVLTCAVVENDAAKVIVDQSKLEPAVVQFAPFEVIPPASSHGADLRSGERRFFQYEYRLRLIAENLFGKDVPLPETKLSYHVQSQVARAAAIQGRDQSYVLPPFSVRLLSLVPTDAADIRDTTIETFTDIDQRSFRASVLIVIGGILFALAGLMVLLSLVRLYARYRQPAAATSRLVSDFAVLRAAGRELRAVQRAREAEGWTPDLMARALAGIRIAAASALGRVVSQSLVSQQPAVSREPAVTPAVRTNATAARRIGGQLIVRSGWPRGKPVAISASVTPQALANEIAWDSHSPKRAALLEALERALTRFTSATYGRDTKVDAATLDESFAAASGTLNRLMIEQTWVMKRLSRRRALPSVESGAWSR